MPSRAAIVASSGLVLWTLSLGAADREPPPREHRPVMRGRVLLPDDGSPLGLRAYLTAPSRLDSTDVDAAGAFAFALPRVTCDSVDIRIDAADGHPRRYHPARVRVAVAASGDLADLERIRVLLIPTSYRIEGGTYAGVTVPITLDDALAGSHERARYWRVSRSPFGYGIPIGWAAERFPVPIAVFGRTTGLRSQDSASFWAIARQLERDLGQTVFRPISLDSAQNEGWSVTMSLNPAEDTPGVTFLSYGGRGDVFDATIAIRSAALLSDQRIVTHELLHALGFGHAVGWVSVMSAAYQPVPRATAADVAYAQLFYRLRRVHLEQRATHGILASAAETRRQPPINAWVTACPADEPAS